VPLPIAGAATLLTAAVDAHVLVAKKLSLRSLSAMDASIREDIDGTGHCIAV
jgi:hypothetical protein